VLSSYNSAIFGVTAGQDYYIHIVNGTDISTLDGIKSGKKLLTLNSWQSLYDTKYVPDAGNLWVVADSASFTATLNQTSFIWNLGLPNNTSIAPDWSDIGWPPHNTSVQVLLSLSEGTTEEYFYFADAELTPGSREVPNRRLVVPLVNYTSSMPKIEWPEPIVVDVTQANTWKNVLPTYNNSWMYDPPVQLGMGFSQPLINSSSIQVALPFMLVVVVCNALKVLAVYYTLRESSSQHLVTQGDAISSFLERPDPTTLGYCTLDKETIVKVVNKPVNEELQLWKVQLQPYGRIVRARITMILLFS
jgi:hypothetical protein